MAALVCTPAVRWSAGGRPSAAPSRRLLYAPALLPYTVPPDHVYLDRQGRLRCWRNDGANAPEWSSATRRSDPPMVKWEYSGVGGDRVECCVTSRASRVNEVLEEPYLRPGSRPPSFPPPCPWHRHPDAASTQRLWISAGTLPIDEAGGRGGARRGGRPALARQLGPEWGSAPISRRCWAGSLRSWLPADPDRVVGARALILAEVRLIPIVSY